MYQGEWQYNKSVLEKGATLDEVKSGEAQAKRAARSGQSHQLMKG